MSVRLRLFTFLHKCVLYLLVCLFLVLLWKLVVYARFFDETIVPSPSATWAAMWAAGPELKQDIPYTFGLISGGFIVTVFLSFIVAVSLHLLPKGQRNNN